MIGFAVAPRNHLRLPPPPWGGLGRGAKSTTAHRPCPDPSELSVRGSRRTFSEACDSARFDGSLALPSNATHPRRLFGYLTLLLFLLAGCGPADHRRTVDLWHPMRPEDRAVLEQRIDAFERAHPDINVRPLYKETEELRSGLVSAMLADEGPELIYGPSDPTGMYQAMGALADLSQRLSPEELADFDPASLIRLPSRDDPTHDQLVFVGDRFGNHLALVYNRKLIEKPPQTLDELLALAKKNTVDEDGDGVFDRYGLAWNFTEPFYVVPFLTGFGGWVFEPPTDKLARPVPALDTPQAIAAFRFVAALCNEHRVLPQSADYEGARALFLAGKAAMIIDGDWSWKEYLEPKTPRPNFAAGDAALAVLPMVAETGLPMAPMVAPRGYSLASTARGQAADDAVELLRFLTSEETQRAFLIEQKILPSRLSLRKDPLVVDDPVLAMSVEQARLGKAMPVDLELRAVWDAMRGPYQLLTTGQLDATEAAQRMQHDAVAQINALNRRAKPDRSAFVVYALAAAALAAGLWKQRSSFAVLLSDLRKQRLAYLLALPAMIVILLTVVYPLAYNVLLSFSNMSLTNLRDWQVVGLQNYADAARGESAIPFWPLLLKTLVWTTVNLVFHVAIGVMLAVILHGPLRGKSFYRIALIIPWAVPAYITALTWRGMFDQQFGVVNQLLSAIAGVNNFLPQWLHVGPVNWLGEAGPAFAACIVANVWLGFPFMMVIALGGLQGIPGELYEAARIDRATRWQQFWHITLPMLKPVLVPAITLGAVWTFNNLNVVWLVSNGGEPANQTHILVSYVYKAVFTLYQYGSGAALSMVIFALLLAFSLLFLNRTKATEAVA